MRRLDQMLMFGTLLCVVCTVLLSLTVFIYLLLGMFN